jgi:uncharacterized protein (TIGR03435 family)
MSNRIARSLVAIIAAAPAFSQVPSPTEFEVASIRPNTANDRIVTINIGPGGRFTARGYTLKLLIQQAYGVMGWNISGGPAWLDTDRYDVSAKALVAGNLTEEPLRPLLQRLLAERFKLRFHEGSKEMSGYALLVGRGGPNLRAASDGQEHPETIRMSGVGLRGQGVTSEMLAKMIGGTLGMPVVNQTGLTGVYDIKIEWTQQTDQFTRGLPVADPRDAGRPVEPVGSTLFTALQDQLGLRLTAQKANVRMLIIDSAEKASEN